MTRVETGLRLAIVAVLIEGLRRRDPAAVVNAAASLIGTYLPSVLERHTDVAIRPWHRGYVSGAMVTHAVGMLGPYDDVWWWDHLTHTLSSTIVAAAGYATARAFELHSDGVSLPDRFVFVFILLFVLAFGVFWEVIEFGVTVVASLSGTSSVLVQYGLGDTMLDLLFDTLGGIIVAIWGTAHLTDLVGSLAERFESATSRDGGS